jgi:hypothetical protein
MPVEVSTGDDLVTVEMTDGVAELEAPEGVTVIPDPHRRILKSEPAEPGEGEPSDD